MALAVTAMRTFVNSDETARSFLAKHADLRDLLEPMMFGNTSAAAAPTEGRLLAGRYLVRREMGRGGMGSVYEAFDTELQRWVAIKVLRSVLQLDSHARERFAREAALMARLQHPSIVRVLEVGEAEDSPFLVLELADAVPLSRLLGKLVKGPHTAISDVARALSQLLPNTERPPTTSTPQTRGDSARTDNTVATWAADYVRQVVIWVHDIAVALDYAHSRGLVHRDVKPSNILITREGRALLTDFGLARELGEAGLTVTGEFAGTPDYASPEHFGPPSAIDARSDVFSLGVTLYELLTHRRPFHAESDLAIRERVERYEPHSVRVANHRVTADLAAVVAHAMEKSHAQRYGNAAAFAADLQRWHDGFPVLARPVTTWMRLRRWVARNRLPSAFLAVTTASTVAVSLLAWQAATRARRIQHLLDAGEVKIKLAEANRLWREASARIASFDKRRETWIDLRAQIGKLCDDRDKFAKQLDPNPAATSLPLIHEELAAQSELLAELQTYPGRDKDERVLMATQIERAQARLSTLESLVSGDRPLLAEHQDLIDVVCALDQLRRQAERLDRCIELANRMERSVQEHQKAWDEAIRALADDQRYGGMQLKPQRGLLPIGRDPDSHYLEFAVLGTNRELAQRNAADGRIEMGPQTGMVLVLVPMADNGQGHRTGLVPFFCSKFELSTGQAMHMAETLPLASNGMPVWWVKHLAKERLPAGYIDWDTGVRLLAGFNLALPTGDQWNYACLAGSDTVWWTGDDPDELIKVANFKRPDILWAIDRAGPEANAGRAPGNAFGLVHLHGNVSEWLLDWASHEVLDERTGERSAKGRGRGVAGGGVDSKPHESELTGGKLHDNMDRGFANSTIGLRPVRAVDA